MGLIGYGDNRRRMIRPLVEPKDKIKLELLLSVYDAQELLFALEDCFLGNKFFQKQKSCNPAVAYDAIRQIQGQLATILAANGDR